MEEQDIQERRETTETHQSEASKKSKETETPRTIDKLLRISRNLAKADSNIRQLERNLASAIRREHDEKERLTTELSKVRGFSSTFCKGLELVDILEVTKTKKAAAFDGKAYI